MDKIKTQLQAKDEEIKELTGVMETNVKLVGKLQAKDEKIERLNKIYIQAINGRKEFRQMYKDARTSLKLYREFFGLTKDKISTDI